MLTNLSSKDKIIPLFVVIIFHRIGGVMKFPKFLCTIALILGVVFALSVSTTIVLAQAPIANTSLRWSPIHVAGLGISFSEIYYAEDAARNSDTKLVIVSAIPTICRVVDVSDTGVGGPPLLALAANHKGRIHQAPNGTVLMFSLPALEGKILVRNIKIGPGWTLTIYSR